MRSLKEIICAVIETRALKKLVLSKPIDKNIKKTVGTLCTMRGSLYLTLESFLADGKAIHRNIAADEAADILEQMILTEYKQTNILCEGGECEVKISSKGKVFVSDKIASLESREVEGHNRKKNYILDREDAAEFLYKLGIADENGRILDKKRAKYRQINRFLEIVGDVYRKLPAEGELSVYDLCCGKSYLTFAVYWYLTAVKGRTVKMTGVDRKPDVMEFCKETAENLGFSGMEFFCADVNTFRPERPPHMVVSLHACDIATDMVLAFAVKNNAEVILSTPCCHHEMMSQLDYSPLSFVSDFSMTRQKLCDALTDALRAKRLQAEGYETDILELIDPEETPKNLLIRAFKKGKRREELCEEYRKICREMHIEPFLEKLLDKSM